MSKRTSLIIIGILALLAGIISFVFMFIYSLTQNSDHDYLFMGCFLLLALGVRLLIRSGKRDAEE